MSKIQVPESRHVFQTNNTRLSHLFLYVRYLLTVIIAIQNPL